MNSKLAIIATFAFHLWGDSNMFSVNGAVCNEGDHHSENEGYFIEGINGFGSVVDPDSDTKRKITNSTWAPGIEYPDGSLKFCTGMFCSETCRNDGCPALIAGHTCSMIRFCYESNSGSDVWMMPNEMALALCDFSEATMICGPDDGSGDDCCNYKVEVDHEIKVYFFASKEGCSVGQKAAVEINDFDDVGDACYGMGLDSSRIQKCTCNYEDREMSTLSEPCHSKFVAGCNFHAPDLSTDDSCCDTNSCVGKHKDYTHPIGKALEEERKLLCNDQIPGRCKHSLDDTADCCNSQCTTCGTDQDPFLEWAACSSGNATASSGECGFGGHGGMFSAFECDFSKCAEGELWHAGGNLYNDWMAAMDPDNHIPPLTPEPTPKPTKPPTRAPTNPPEKVEPMVVETDESSSSTSLKYFCGAEVLGLLVGILSSICFM